MKKRLFAFLLALAVSVTAFGVIYAGEIQEGTITGITADEGLVKGGGLVSSGNNENSGWVVTSTPTESTGGSSVITVEDAPAVDNSVEIVDKETEPVETEKRPDVPVTVVKRANPYQASRPQVLRNEDTTLYLVPLANGEYSLDMEHWQDEPVFYNLEPDVRYAVYQRYKETATMQASACSEPIQVMFQLVQEPKPEPVVYTPVKPSASVQQEYRFEYDGNTLWIGMTVEQLLNNMSTEEPTEILPSTWNGLSWYIFASEDFSQVLGAGVTKKGIVESVFVEGENWAWNGIAAFTPYDNVPALSKTAARDLVYELYNEPDLQGQAYAFRLHKRMAHGSLVFENENLEAESRVVFYLTNTYRVLHGLAPQQWCDTAEEVAAAHSKNMAQNNFFSHLDPNRKMVINRLNQKGITPSASAENIAGGQTDGFEAFTAWVNSAGHRKNILFEKPVKTGVGCSVNKGSAYFIYWTQVFYK